MLHTPISSIAANARRPCRAAILSLLRAPGGRSPASQQSLDLSSYDQEAFSGFKSAGGEDDGAGASLPFSRRDMVGGHVPNPLCLLMHAANARHPQSGYHFELA